jgi:hypothetical protein
MLAQWNEQLSMNFGRKGRKPGHFEVHKHSWITNLRARNCNYTFSHSHEGGDRPHHHPDTGPACYTIDKDDWLRNTGLRGGGRKKFTKNPRGQQMPIEEN